MAATPDSVEAVAIHETHHISGWAEEDTVVTWITPGRVRVMHRTGGAILDVPADRFILLDAESTTYHAMSLRDWEGRIAAALQAADEQRASRDDSSGAPRTGSRARAGAAGAQSAAAPTAQFELEGDDVEIAGYHCQRYHLYTRREVFPGEPEMVEEEVWVTRDLALPGGAYDAYRRALDNLDRIGLDPRIQRPPGVALRVETRVHAENTDRRNDEVERSDVVRVERRRFPAALFEIPSGWTRADSTLAGP